MAVSIPVIFTSMILPAMHRVRDTAEFRTSVSCPAGRCYLCVFICRFFIPLAEMNSITSETCGYYEFQLCNTTI